MSEDADDDFWADMASLNSPVSREIPSLRGISKENNEINLLDSTVSPLDATNKLSEAEADSPRMEMNSGALEVHTSNLPESPVVCPLKKRPIRYKEVSPSTASGGESTMPQHDWNETSKESESHDDTGVKFPSPRPPNGPKISSSSSNHTSPSSHQSDLCQQSEPSNGSQGLFVDDFDHEEAEEEDNEDNNNVNHNAGTSSDRNVAMVEGNTTTSEVGDDGVNVVTGHDEDDAVDLSAIEDAINEVMNTDTAGGGGLEDDASNGEVVNVNYRIFKPLPQVGFVPDSAGMKKKKCVKVSLSGSGTSKGYKHSSFARDISCSNLRCLKCNFSVLIFNECAWEDSVDYMFFRNNVPNEVKLSKKLISKTESCAYCCQCSWTHNQEDVDLKQVSHIQWVCGSHLET